MDAPLLADAAFVAGWNPASRQPAQQRLARLLAHAVDPGELGRDTLGDRNRRLLALQADWIGRPIEAQVTCACGTVSTFELPSAAVRALPQAAGRQVQLDDLRFRLPNMADLGLDGRAGVPAPVEPAALARACHLGGDRAPTPEDIPRLEALWADADPAAVLEAVVQCSGCAAPITADVEVSVFVARDLDGLWRSLLRSVDVLARAYGWTEAEVLALPAWRRRAYLAMVEGLRAEPLPQARRVPR